MSKISLSFHAEREEIIKLGEEYIKCRKKAHAII